MVGSAPVRATASKSHSQLLARRLCLRRDIATAIRHQQFHAVYQPIVRLTDRRLSGFEALMRWKHPLLGSVPPIEFVALAEREGLLWSATRHLVHTATAAMAAFRYSNPHAPLPHLSINLSARMLDGGACDKLIDDLLIKTGYTPQALILELTESAALRDYYEASRVMRRLRAAGVRFALDDFGSGHSSLQILNQLPFDLVKLDRALLLYGLRSVRNLRLLGSLARLFRSRGLVAIVEGVESEQHADMLSDIGFDFAQGFQFGPPERQVTYSAAGFGTVAVTTEAAVGYA